MNNLQFADAILERLQEREPRFHPQAYVFVLSSLHAAVAKLRPPRHITGRELAFAVRDVARERFGLLAQTVLEYWGITTTLDIGQVVFALIDCGVLVKQDDDHIEDFDEIFDFDDAFEREYPWQVAH
jgi:uncharacterized repeat protein (TIGR04138 family)